LGYCLLWAVFQLHAEKGSNKCWKTGRATFWATFSQTHRVALPTTSERP
jgi:hypothetical protein